MHETLFQNFLFLAFLFFVSNLTSYFLECKKLICHLNRLCPDGRGEWLYQQSEQGAKLMSTLKQGRVWPLFLGAPGATAGAGNAPVEWTHRHNLRTERPHTLANAPLALSPHSISNGSAAKVGLKGVFEQDPLPPSRSVFRRMKG